MTGFMSRYWRHDCAGDKGCFALTLPSWDDICDTLAEATGRALRPTDVDGMVEVNDHFLFIEEKPTAEDLPEGQRRALLGLSRRDRITVLYVRSGGLGSEVQMLVLRDGVGTGWQPRTRQQLLDWIAEWARAADTT